MATTSATVGGDAADLDAADLDAVESGTVESGLAMNSAKLHSKVSNYIRNF